MTNSKRSHRALTERRQPPPPDRPRGDRTAGSTASKQDQRGRHAPHRPSRRFDLRQRRLCAAGRARRRAPAPGAAAGRPRRRRSRRSTAPTTAGVARQLERLPADATHLVASAGGSDALGNIGVLKDSSRSIADALTRLAAIGDGFGRGYRAMLGSVLDRGRPTAALCTIYDPRYPDPRLQRLAVTGLALFNDPSSPAPRLRTACRCLDLRLICDEDADFANPDRALSARRREDRGGHRPARRRDDFARRRSEVFVR